MDKILLTGGLGYIGSHVAVELCEKGYDIVIIDDLSNSEAFVLDRIEEITGKKIDFEKGDIRDAAFLDQIFKKYPVNGVIHFAAKKAVGESVNKPLLYYDINVGGLVSLLKAIEKTSIKKLVFSSSCTVYGTPESLPVTENSPFRETPSPYGKTKQMCENILTDVASVCAYDIVSLRYFNPVGAHSSAKIGELPKGTPNNLVPFITQTAAGLRDRLSVFGGDYDTIDGTAIRDYIHVVDLAKAHVQALATSLGKYEALNIGTGNGFSVLEVVNTFIEETGQEIQYSIADRRAGDVEKIYGDTALANEKIKWTAQLGLKEMVVDAWRWEKKLKDASET
ncbi:MAG: UDP-glucose 4-epimerase [Cyclobacteriaceae bacterium]|jgi:UDP-glucose 4-epimerase